MPVEFDINSKEVVIEAKKAIKRALSRESKLLLPERVKQLAEAYGYSYSEVKSKPMKSRWGSCSTDQTIALNCYLLMMPWSIIDYVIAHELSHTKLMNHSGRFWKEVSRSTPDYKRIKKQLNEMQPDIHALYL